MSVGAFIPLPSFSGASHGVYDQSHWAGKISSNCKHALIHHSTRTQKIFCPDRLCH